MSLPMSTTNMHPFYHVFFQKIDPLIMIYSGYTNLRNRSFAVAYPFHHTGYRGDFFSEQMLGLITALAAMSALTLHYSEDIKVWRLNQVVLLIWNLSCLSGTSDAMEMDEMALPGRRGWSVGFECIYGAKLWTVLIIIRILFLLGIGRTRHGMVIQNGVLRWN